MPYQDRLLRCVTCLAVKLKFRWLFVLCTGQVLQLLRNTLDPITVYLVPATPYDAKGLLLASIEDDNVVIFSEDKTLYGLKGEVPEEYYTVPIGKAAVRREGKDLTIVTIGKMLYVAYEVADRLAKDNISVEVIDLRTVAPWDEETVLNSVKKTGRLIIVDEANPHNNTATDIASVVSDKAFDYLDGPVKCVCAPNTPVPFTTNLEQAYIPDADKVLKVADELIQDLKGQEGAYGNRNFNAQARPNHD